MVAITLGFAVIMLVFLWRNRAEIDKAVVIAYRVDMVDLHPSRDTAINNDEGEICH